MVNKVAFIFLFLVSSILAQNIEELFTSANRSYQQKQYDKAVELYEQIVSSGYEGVSLYYNLGNAYYRSGNLGYAILYYEKALRLSPGDYDIQHNLIMANARTVDKLTEFPPFFLFRIWEDLLGLLSLSGWINSAYIMFLLFLLSASGYILFWNPLYRKYSFFAGIFILILFIFTSAVTIVKYNSEVNIVKGILIERQSNVKTSPDESSNDAFVIHEGLKVTLEDKVGEWFRIRLNDGKTGWIYGEHIRII
jgi:tetratricopeptide (TPR) repeat protein